MLTVTAPMRMCTPSLDRTTALFPAALVQRVEKDSSAKMK